MVDRCFFLRITYYIQLIQIMCLVASYPMMDYSEVTKTSLSSDSKIIPQIDTNIFANTEQKIRIKRQSGGGKYTEAAQMPQVKVLRLMLQMLKNTWASVYVGGVHPFHHEVPKPIVALYKQKIFDFFFPEVGQEEKA